jgi:hypothetical protein
VTSVPATRGGLHALTLGLLAACSRGGGADAVPHEVHSFEEAAAEVGRLTGAKGHAGEDGTLDGVLLFDIKGSAAEFVSKNGGRFRPGGAYLFVYEHGFGRHPDVVGLASTTDKFDLVRRVQTDGANYGHDNAAVITWLREIDGDDPFELTGAGRDFVEGFFRAKVTDRKRLAVRIYAFCPDFVDQGIGLTEKGEPHALIEGYFASNQEFFFWWD